MIPFHDVDWSRVPDHALGANVRVEIQLPAGMALESVDGDRPAEDARIVFRVKIELGNIDRAAKHRGVLIIRIDRRHDADAFA